MTYNQADKLAFYFHLDSRLAERSNEFHFHVLLDDSSESGAPSPVPASFLSEVTFNWCIPPGTATNPTQQVKATGSGKGEICILGRATIDGDPLEKIEGKIYATAGEIPVVRPLTGLTVGERVNSVSGDPVQETPSGCETVNFRILKFPGAAHSNSGVQNWIAIWIYGPDNKWHRSSPVPFMGITDPNNKTECDYIPTESAPMILPGQFAFTGPEQFLISFDKKNGGSQSIILRRNKPSNPLIEQQHWKSCRKANPDSEWELWVEENGAQQYGVLLCKALNGKQFAYPQVWRSDNWNQLDSNILDLSSPHELPDGPTSIRVKSV